MTEDVDLVISDIDQLVTVSPFKNPLTGRELAEPEIIEHGALALSNGVIEAAGSHSVITEQFDARKSESAPAPVCSPGLVDAHTHLLYAGDRSRELDMRVQGASYQDIAETGGGILQTVQKTRNAPDAVLLQSLRDRLDRALSTGTTTMEIKTGYGLETSEELRHLRLIQEVSDSHPVNVIPTFLGAHTIPPEFEHKREDYVTEIVEEMLPAVSNQGIAEFCDVFVEKEAFSVEQARTILTEAKKHGLSPRLHAEQFSRTGSALLGAELDAASVDHLEAIDSGDISRLAENQIPAVLLPGTRMFLNMDQKPPARTLIEENVPIVLATDHNPGSCTLLSLPLTMTMACLDFGLRPAETLAACTLNAAGSLNCSDTRGRIDPGLNADFVFWDVEDFREIPYWFGQNRVNTVYTRGTPVYNNENPSPHQQ